MDKFTIKIRVTYLHTKVGSGYFGGIFIKKYYRDGLMKGKGNVLEKRSEGWMGRFYLLVYNSGGRGLVWRCSRFTILLGFLFVTWLALCFPGGLPLLFTNVFLFLAGLPRVRFIRAGFAGTGVVDFLGLSTRRSSSVFVVSMFSSRSLSFLGLAGLFSVFSGRFGFFSFSLSLTLSS